MCSSFMFNPIFISMHAWYLMKQYTHTLFFQSATFQWNQGTKLSIASKNSLHEHTRQKIQLFIWLQDCWWTFQWVTVMLIGQNLIYSLSQLLVHEAFRLLCVGAVFTIPTLLAFCKQSIQVKISCCRNLNTRMLH